MQSQTHGRAMEQGGAAIFERDLALAMHETFLSSGSEDAVSPRFHSHGYCSPLSGSPRTPRTSSLLGTNTGSSGGTPCAVGTRQLEANRAQPGTLEDEVFLKRLIETEFEHHDVGVARLNNGSFGSCPRSILLRQEEFARSWLKEPDVVYYEYLETALLESRRRVASFVNSPVEEIVLLDNVTEGASLVAIDVNWAFVEGRYKKGDSILMTGFTYGAVRNAFEAYCSRAGARILKVDIPFPVSSNAEIVASFEKCLKGAKEERRVIRVAVIDHIVSMPSIILPVKQLVALCRSYGIEQIFVDGAQAVGNVHVDVRDIDADYYTGNLHKWLFAPSAVAFFHCKSKHLSRLHHPTVSHAYGHGLVAECNWVGTKDYSPKLVVPTVIDFVDSIPGGWTALMAHNHKKVIEVGKMLAEAWGTYCAVAPELCASMVMVGLPPSLGLRTPNDTSVFRTCLRQQYSIVVHSYTAEPGRETGKPQSDGVTAHLRISHQIYNTWDEYIRLRDVVNALVLEKTGKLSS